MARHDARVLVADDHAAVRRSLRDLLQDGGLRVIGEAADGREAVRLCEHLRPDVVVIDISMPVLNGFEAARAITRVSPVTKIVVLTGHSLNEYVTEAFRLGAVGFVRKQQAAFSLLAAIQAVLQGKTYDCRESAA